MIKCPFIIQPKTNAHAQCVYPCSVAVATLMTLWKASPQRLPWQLTLGEGVASRPISAGVADAALSGLYIAAIDFSFRSAVLFISFHLSFFFSSVFRLISQKNPHKNPNKNHRKILKKLKSNEDVEEKEEIFGGTCELIICNGQ